MRHQRPTAKNGGAFCYKYGFPLGNRVSPYIKWPQVQSALFGIYNPLLSPARAIGGFRSANPIRQREATWLAGPDPAIADC